MRPLYLQIKGFGPYLEAEITEEAFKLINEEKLFLISGEIGAGKTTLFDAILFALFGEASFPDRTPKDLISHLLSERPSLYPEVTFKFFLDGKIYKIKRRPTYGKSQSYLALWINEKLYSERITEANLKIKEILGLKADQFKKVFLLPQGEYRKILLSKPDERKELFELLFDTEFISRLEVFFKETLKQKREVLASLEDRERELLHLAEVSTLEELKKKGEENERRLLSIEGNLRDLLTKIQRLEEEWKYWEKVTYLWEEYHKTSAALQNLEKERPEIENLKSRIQKLRVLKEKSFHYEHLKRLWLKLKKGKEVEKNLLVESREISALLREKEADWVALRAREAHHEELKAKLIKLEDLLKTYQKRLFLISEIEKLEKEYRDLANRFDELTVEEERCQGEIESLRQEKEAFKKVEELKQALEELKKIEALLQEYHQGASELENFVERIKALEAEYESLKIKHEALKERSLAISLAEKLRKGEPCPVCGSPHHPKKATPDLFLFSSLENIEMEMREKERELESLKKRRSQLEGKLTTLRALIKLDGGELEAQKGKILSELSPLEGKTFRHREFSLYELEEKKLKEKVENLSRERERVRKALEFSRTKGASLEGELKGLTQETTENFSEEDIKREITLIKTEIETFEQTKEKLANLLKELERRATQNETTLKALQRELKETTEEYRKTFKEVWSLVRAGVFKNLKEIKGYWDELGRLEDLERRLQAFEREKAALERARELLLEELKALSLSFSPDFKEILQERVATLTHEKRLLEEKRQDLTMELGKRREVLSQIRSLENNLSQILKEKKGLEEEYGILERIYNLLSGKPNRISFHSFVLSRFLGLILKRANDYFSEFTFGRYHFVEGEIFSRNFILEVFDIYTGQRREVKTLSGGESFLASLAFALGTSDTLLMLAKKHSLETLLIDEGFGSLDEGTLDKVTETLLQISQKRGKIVGIISHLKELRDRFPVILEIIKDKNEGSKVRLRRNY